MMMVDAFAGATPDGSRRKIEEWELRSRRSLV
jgi:hypothetical protein